MRGTYEEGGLRNLKGIMGRYKIKILALQETKLKGNEILNIQKFFVASWLRSVTQSSNYITKTIEPHTAR